MEYLKEFTAGFFEALDFTERGPDSRIGDAEFSQETIARLKADCRSFWARCYWLAVHSSPDQMGRDFWLTRNRHGVGFWDRKGYNGFHKEHLTVMAVGYGEIELFIGPDGLIYA